MIINGRLLMRLDISLCLFTSVLSAILVILKLACYCDVSFLTPGNSFSFRGGGIRVVYDQTF